MSKMTVTMYQHVFSTLSREAVWSVVGDVENLYRQSMIFPTIGQSLVTTEQSFFQQKTLKCLRRTVNLRELKTEWKKNESWSKKVFTDKGLNIEWSLSISDGVRVVKQNLTEQGIDVKIGVVLTGGDWLHRHLARLFLRIMLGRLHRYLKNELAFRATRFKTERRYARSVKVQHTQLQGALARAPKVYRPELMKLVDTYIRHANDAQLLLVSSENLAEEWQQEHSEVLRTMLAASNAGIWQSRWAVYCDRCSFLMQHCALIAEIPERMTCIACRSEQVIDASRHARLRFTIHPSIRSVPTNAEILMNPSSHHWMDEVAAEHLSSLPESELTLDRVIFLDEYRHFFGWDVLAPKQLLAVGKCRIVTAECPTPAVTKSKTDPLYHILDDLEEIETIAKQNGLVCVRQCDRTSWVLGFSEEEVKAFSTAIHEKMDRIKIGEVSPQVYLRAWNRTNDLFLT